MAVVGGGGAPGIGCKREQPVAKGAEPCAKAKQEGALAWIADDYPAALACAKQKKIPLVIDLWAPWCHTCLSMQSTVFTDPSLAVHAPRFVFVALDTDREVNAAVVAKFPPSAWPTFYAISPDEAVLARFVGAASLAQFHAFLDSGARALAGGIAGADARLLGAERAAAVKDYATADEELTIALEIAPKDWSRRADALTALIVAKTKRGDHAGCLTLAETAELGNTAAATDFLITAMACADDRA
ncbi:MAG: thioredoxin family protein, partial [Deltaproteobacteria bacterium]|nr:thioredoxin family protein [Deltaproteobacteria bacterium]